MKALVIHGPGHISYETIADAKVSNSRSALVKASQCGLCGSDLHPYDNDTGKKITALGTRRLARW